ncbi:GGDEF domain-containing protein [Pseudoalteromonas sp.]|uniref:GGDEF domain-containing protein n=1 Tax=Pseudoalteromonas sp. TaxID=53249 RepID=UPI003562B60C
MQNLKQSNSLKTILSERLITTLFQPILDIEQETVLGYEALSRGPENSSLYSPLELFAQAEQDACLSELELLCREKAIENFVKQGLPGKLFINVSPTTLLQATHPKGETLHLLAKYGLPTSRVVIEITEREPLCESDLLFEAIKHYRDLGLHIAIDDFGSGYSGLKQWSELKPDIVKIDRYFIDHCDKSVVKKEFLRSILELAKITNTRVIAEGIERTQELELLKSLGVELAQGFLLERPALSPCQSFAECIAAQKLVDMPRNTQNYSRFIGNLLLSQQSILASTNCGMAKKYFEQDKSLQSLVVLNQESRPVGILHRDQLSELFSSTYGAALHAKHSVTEIMDNQPLVVDRLTALDSVSQKITDSDFDIRRYIIVTQEGAYLGVVPIRDILKHITDEKIKNAQHANPLTMLPGNVAINENIERRLNAKHNFELAYIDLNHFKQFNDLYGYASGDMVIKLLAEICRRVCNRKDCFIGHIGGDDFMLVCSSGIGEALCQQIITEFETAVKAYFTPEHVSAGGYWATNREGEKKFVPLLTLSIGLVNPDIEHCENSHQVAALATDAKKEAKRFVTSHLFICKRRRPTMAIVRLPVAK